MRFMREKGGGGHSLGSYPCRVGCGAKGPGNSLQSFWPTLQGGVTQDSRREEALWINVALKLFAGEAG